MAHRSAPTSRRCSAISPRNRSMASCCALSSTAYTSFSPKDRPSYVRMRTPCTRCLLV
jgi:hypothetical protein